MEVKAVYSPEAEPQLLQQAADGSREAYALLYKHYLPKVYKYLYEIIRSKEDTEEILQDIFLRLWERKEELTTVKTFNSYLFRIARNKLMNHYDHQKVKRKAIAYFEKAPEEIGVAADDRFIFNEYKEVVRVALSSLSLSSRQVFEMSTERELSHDQIADEMNISKAMVKKQLYAAKRHVKEYLQLHAGLTASIALIAGVTLVK